MMPIDIANMIQRRFSIFPPLLLANDKDSLKFEMKPYLQPFERELATRELQALLQGDGPVAEKYGLHLVRSGRPVQYFRERLTYWQRVGTTVLEPTVQNALEFTQNGSESTTEKTELHRARRLRYGPHDLHEYRGKFFPQLVRSLMNISGVPDDGLVLDPMCGSGTTPCETVAAGRAALAADLNPLSVLIAKVKAGIVRERPEVFAETIDAYLRKLKFRDSEPDHFWQGHDLAYLRRWFAEPALKDIAAILRSIERVDSALYRDFLRVCLSEIVRSVSWQKEVDLRVRKDVRPYLQGAALEKFRTQVEEQTDRIYPYLCVLPRSRKRTLKVVQGNAVQLDELFPEYVGKVDLLVTSPPYATALPYIDTDRLSLVVLGLLSRQRHGDVESLMVGTREITDKERLQGWSQFETRKKELPRETISLIERIASHNHGPDVGFRRRNLPSLLARYFLAMSDAMRSARSLMAPGSYAYYVVGNNSSTVNGEKVEIPTDRFLFAIGQQVGWKGLEMIPMELLVSRDIFRENRGSAETILCFKA
jgi:site-specific DNA-methyltransferase (cytosine-N4-specific)